MSKDKNMLTLMSHILESSVINLFLNQPDILKNTFHTNMTEWNFTHHLANEIAEYIFWLDYDVDVIKKNFKNRRPDIIFHKRGTNILNFLVIEVKIQNNMEKDIRRIKSDWMRGALNYRFGASVSIRTDKKWEITILDRSGKRKLIEGKLLKDRAGGANFTIISKIPERDQWPIIALVKQILAIKAKDPDADTSSLEQEIDRLVYKLYGLTEEEMNFIRNYGHQIPHGTGRK